MAVRIASVEDARALEGTEIGLTDWILVDQQRIDKFADATGDHQWIHTDPERAAREFPLGTTCAHGALTISLITGMTTELVELKGDERFINYGINKARFRAMVPSGSKVRIRAVLKSGRKRAGALQLILSCAVEMEGHEKPVATAECVILYFLEGI
ncbi:MAG: MaoC family dehydratase [Gammaproteobacteria bacterium]|jgi:acyl dehydratase|nr:MaoC family dehydratase [Gammaproteobacteria bacterium]MDP6616308.1 MaoC family dehydratase [Gammaproteobacteria bacterium]MDP6694022.1 MaoC family dehydratase [Gammaproteobacteria bacterium]